MQTQSWFKNALPNIIAIVAFLIISALFSTPALQGNRLAPHDTVSGIYQSKDGVDYHKEHGKVAGWTNSQFAGMPATMIYAPTGNNWFGEISVKLMMLPEDGLVNPIGLMFVCMLGAFALLSSLRTSTLIAAIGAVCYALTSYIPILIGAGHISKVIALAYIPGAIGGFIYILRGELFKGGILYSVFMCFFLSGWHLQIVYYSIFIFVAIGIYYLVDAFKQGTIAQFVKSSAIVVLITVGAALTVYSGLKGTSNYSKYSIRGGKTELTIGKEDKLLAQNGGLSKEYAFDWSNGVGETFCAIVPNLYGGASGSNIGTESNFGEALSSLGVPDAQIENYTSHAPTYFGPQPFLSGPIYFGALVCFLAILALFVVKNRLKWILLGIGIFFAMLSWGKNFSALNYWLFDNLPMFNKFRSPNMALAFTAITTIALAFWGLATIVKQSQEEKQTELFKQFKNAAITTLVLVLAIIGFSQIGMDYNGIGDAELKKSFGEHASKLMSALKDDRAAMALKDGFRSLVFILIGIGAVGALVKKRISAQVAIIIIGVASIIDLWGVSKRYLNSDMFMDMDTITYEYFTPNAAISEILKDKDPNFKVLDLSINTFNDSKTTYFVKTIGGYHPAKLQTYQDMIVNQIGKLNGAVLNMLNAKYIITKQGEQGQPAAIPNPNALGNAWFVSNIKFTKTADETMLSMNAPSISEPLNDSAKTAFNPSVQAVVRDQYQSEIGKSEYTKDSSATIKLTKYDLANMEYESNNNSDGFAVFSEIYYPENWKAYVDGKEVKIIPVNYILRGLKVPAGKHKITFKYEDVEFVKNGKMELVGSILISLIILAFGVLYFRNKNKNEVAKS